VKSPKFCLVGKPLPGVQVSVMYDQLNAVLLMSEERYISGWHTASVRCFLTLNEEKCVIHPETGVVSLHFKGALLSNICSTVTFGIIERLEVRFCE
jgi:hypothetical protein